MKLQDINLKDAETIFDDTYGRGHGKEKTVTKFVSIFNISETDAYELFQSISES